MSGGTGVTLSGFDEYREILTNLPRELKAQASRIVAGTANAMAANVKRGYPNKTGHLLAGVKVIYEDRGEYVAGAAVKNTAKLAYIFENGTEARHYYTRKGTRHFTGKMPPGRVFIPEAIRRRRRMYEDLIDFVKRATGLEVVER